MAKLKKKEKCNGKVKGCSGKVKGTDQNSTDGNDGDRARDKSFNGHDLSDLPHDALPFVDGSYKGKHSYTVYMGDYVPGFQYLLS